MNPPHEVHDDAYGCMRVNGILSPTPINSNPPQPSTSEDPSTRRRTLSASEVVDTKEIALTLYQCQRTLVYILHLREVVTGNLSAYTLEPPFEHSSGKRRVKAKKTKDNSTTTLVPVDQEIFPDNEGKFDLSISQRVEGRWRKETRSRTTCAVTEPFYYHERVRGAMRTVGEVATFIICNDVY